MIAFGVRFALAFCGFVLVATLLAPSALRADETQSFDACGVIASIRADRKVVNITHEKIEGYMNAMTMTFEPRAVAQLDGLKAGDAVSFSFTDTGDGHRFLNAIKRRDTSDKRASARSVGQETQLARARAPFAWEPAGFEWLNKQAQRVALGRSHDFVEARSSKLR